MKKITALTFFLLVLAGPAMAETVYVTERQSVSIRAGMTAEDPVLGRAVTGTGLELLEKNDTHTRVRAADGTEGWIANGLLTREKPAAIMILAAETRAKQAQADAAKLAKKVQALEKQLQAEKNKPQPEAAPEPAPEAGDTASATEPGKFGFDLLWFGISFAMLIIGFVAGALWLRERTRRKLGGMHIRVS